MTESGVLCPCLSGKDLPGCCGPFEDAPHPSGSASSSAAHASLRSLLLSAATRSRDMVEMWFAFLDELPEAARVALGEEGDRQVLLDHFLWDWFHRYSESRPLCQVARALDATDLRGASRLDEWSLSAWEPWRVVSGKGGTWTLDRLGGERRIEVRKSFPGHAVRAGDGILARILPHLGHSFLGLSVSVFPGATGCARLQAGYENALKSFGLSTQVHLRPDIHNEIWHSLHTRLLELSFDEVVAPGRAIAVLDDSILDRPQDALGGDTPRQSARHEFGRHRLRQWLKGLGGADRRAVERLLD